MSNCGGYIGSGSCDSCTSPTPAPNNGYPDCTSCSDEECYSNCYDSTTIGTGTNPCDYMEPECEEASWNGVSGFCQAYPGSTYASSGENCYSEANYSYGGMECVQDNDTSAYQFGPCCYCDGFGCAHAGDLLQAHAVLGADISKCRSKCNDAGRAIMDAFDDRCAARAPDDCATVPGCVLVDQLCVPKASPCASAKVSNGTACRRVRGASSYYACCWCGADENNGLCLPKLDAYARQCPHAGTRFCSVTVPKMTTPVAPGMANSPSSSGGGMLGPLAETRKGGAGPSLTTYVLAGVVAVLIVVALCGLALVLRRRLHKLSAASRTRAAGGDAAANSRLSRKSSRSHNARRRSVRSGEYGAYNMLQQQQQQYAPAVAAAQQCTPPPYPLRNSPTRTDRLAPNQPVYGQMQLAQPAYTAAPVVGPAAAPSFATSGFATSSAGGGGSSGRPYDVAPLAGPAASSSSSPPGMYAPTVHLQRGGAQQQQQQQQQGQQVYGQLELRR